MDKIMVCVGLLYRYDQKASPCGPGRSDGNGKQEPVKIPDRSYVEIPGLRRPTESWITKY
jgi:hypothetical protein